MIQGSIDISSLKNWFLDLDYEIPLNPSRGFDLVDINDSYRYSSITAHLFKGTLHESFFKQKFTQLENCLFAVSKMPPGSILPYHIDKYAYFKKKFKITHEKIERVIVFLEDWKPGHISEIDGTPVTNWKKGDWIMWAGKTPHMAANLGHKDRYTLQITSFQRD